MSTPETEVVYATLVRGRVYFLGNREFLNGNAEPVNPAEREWLEKHAVDQVSVEDEAEHQLRSKFKFSSSPDADTAPRARRRG